jgi:shikimate kinase
MIRLVGPGGAGKSTIGAALAVRLGLPFVDLDALFTQRAGDISHYIDCRGYAEYVHENVETYASFVDRQHDLRGVMALSSGFMTYVQRIHPRYDVIREEIAASPTTFVLLCSLDRQSCIAETTRRQLARPFARSREREETVIQERYPVYMALPARKIETMRPLADVVAEIETALSAASPGGRARRRAPTS